MISALPRADLHLLVDHDRHHQEGEQHRRHRGSDRPVLVLEELGPQRLADHDVLRAAEQVGNDEFADDRDEAQQRAGGDARQRERQRHQPERLPARAAEVGGGFEQRLVQLFEAGVDRQHHERQVRIDDADVDRGVGGEPHRRRVDQAERHKRLIQQAFPLQDGGPGIDADEERGPERQHHQHEQDRLPAARRAGDAVGQRNADRQQDQRSKPPQLQGS